MNRPARLKTVFLLLGLLATCLAGPLPAAAAASPNADAASLAVPQAPGGDVRALALAPSDPNTLYSLVGDGRFFRSLDGGASWQQRYLFASIDNNLAVDPGQPLTVYAYGISGLLRSPDGGDSWENVHPLGEVFAAVSSDVLYAGGGTDACGSFGEKIYRLDRSEDGGQTWHSVSLGCLEDVEQLAVLPSQPEVVYLSVRVPGATAGTLLKSTDGGQTWDTFSLPLEGAWLALLIDPDDPQRLFASGLYGILRSLDGGETWEQVSSKSMGEYFSLALSGGSLYAVERTVSRAPVYRSDDGGESWWASVSLLPAGTLVLQADPSGPGRLWAGLASYGVYRTESGGAVWTSRNQGIRTPASIRTLAASESDPGVMYAAIDTPYPALFRTQDGGLTWGDPLPGFPGTDTSYSPGFRSFSPAGPAAPAGWYPIPEIYDLLVHPLHPEVAWVATSMGVFETLNGQDWQRKFSFATAVDLTVSAAAPDLPYAALYDEGGNLYVAQRRCDHPPLPCEWTSNKVNSSLLTISKIKADPTAPQRLLADGMIYVPGGKANGIFESLDAGLTWQQIGLVNVEAALVDWAFQPASTQVSVASFIVTINKVTYGWLYRSLDGGATWQDWSAGAHLPPPFWWRWPLAMNEPGEACVGSWDGIYRRTFDHAAWEPFALQGHWIQVLVYRPGSAPALLAAGGYELWRLDLPPVQRAWLPLVSRGAP